MTKMLARIATATCLFSAFFLGVGQAATSTLPPTARGEGPAPESKPFYIERLDPALDNFLSTDAKLENLGDRYGLTEGPVWVQDKSGGYLLFSDLIANVIYKRTPDGEVSVFLDKAGYSGDDINNAGTQTFRGRTYVLMIGPNGETMDAQGRLIWCASPDGTIVRLEKDGARTVLAGKYQGKRFNGPNDLVVTSNGAVYFTDSDFGLRGGSKSPDKELSFNGVYLVKDGNVTLLKSTADHPRAWPNGIALSPDQKYLYLSEGFARIMRYPIKDDNTLGTPSLLTEGGGGIGDGMKVDVEGNLYSTGGAGPGHVRITSADGKILGRIYLPVIGGEPKQQICATNVAFGDPDGKGLYITACEAVYKIRVKVPGVLPGPKG